MKREERELQNGGGLFSGTPSVVAAAHELKSPLALIRQLAFSVADDPETAVVSAERILLTADRALRLTSNITRHARLEDSFFVTEPLNAQMICEEVIEEISPLYRARGRELILRSRRSSPLVVANRELLHRVLLGFADNALHYALDSEPIRMSVSAHRSKHTVRLSVRDFGPAVESDVWKSTDDFAARPTAMHERPASSGLGLYLARQFAEAMRASVGVTRHRDGASFYVDIPESLQLSLL